MKGLFFERRRALFLPPPPLTKAEASELRKKRAAAEKKERQRESLLALAPQKAKVEFPGWEFTEAFFVERDLWGKNPPNSPAAENVAQKHGGNVLWGVDRASDGVITGRSEYVVIPLFPDEVGGRGIAVYKKFKWEKWDRK